VVCAKCFGKLKNIDYGRLLLAVSVVFGCLVLVDLAILKILVRLTNSPRPGIIVADCHPFPEMVAFSLNWILPPVVAIFLVTPFAARNQLRKLPGFVGAILSLLSIAGSIYIGYYLFAKHLGRSFTETVWWL
jgi:hypothetical protein